MQGQPRLRWETSDWPSVRRWARGVLLVGSVGLALHLVLLQIPGLERSLRLVAGTSHPLVGAAFLAELLLVRSRLLLDRRAALCLQDRLGLRARLRRHGLLCLGHG